MRAIIKQAAIPSVATVAAALALALNSPAGAQTFCPEGRTSTGKCVKPELAQSLRMEGILSTQQKFSFTNQPVLPSQDGAYYAPPDFGEIRRLFGAGVTGAGR